MSKEQNVQIVQEASEQILDQASEQTAFWLAELCHLGPESKDQIQMILRQSFVQVIQVSMIQTLQLLEQKHLISIDTEALRSTCHLS